MCVYTDESKRTKHKKIFGKCFSNLPPDKPVSSLKKGGSLVKLINENY